MLLLFLGDDCFWMLKLPSVRQHLQEFLLRCLCLIWHVCDDAVQVQARIDIMCLARCQQGADAGHVPCCLVVATESMTDHSLGDPTETAETLAWS